MYGQAQVAMGEMVSRMSIGLEGTLASLPFLGPPLYRGARLTDALSLGTGVEAWLFFVHWLCSRFLWAPL